jgi:hypothetical protein
MTLETLQGTWGAYEEEVALQWLLLSKQNSLTDGKSSVVHILLKLWKWYDETWSSYMMAHPVDGPGVYTTKQSR